MEYRRPAIAHAGAVCGCSTSARDGEGAAQDAYRLREDERGARAVGAGSAARTEADGGPCRSRDGSATARECCRLSKNRMPIGRFSPPSSGQRRSRPVKELRARADSSARAARDAGKLQKRGEIWDQVRIGGVRLGEPSRMSNETSKAEDVADRLRASRVAAASCAGSGRGDAAGDGAVHEAYLRLAQAGTL